MEVELVTQHIWGWNVRKIFILVNIKNGETRSKTRRIPSQWGYVKLFIYKYVFLIFMFKQLWNCSSLTGVQDARAWWPCVCVGGGGGVRLARVGRELSATTKQSDVCHRHEFVPEHVSQECAPADLFGFSVSQEIISPSVLLVEKHLNLGYLCYKTRLWFGVHELGL